MDEKGHFQDIEGRSGGADKVTYSDIFLGQILISNIEILSVSASDMP